MFERQVIFSFLLLVLVARYVNNIDGLVQEIRNSIGNTLKLRLSCSSPSVCFHPHPNLQLYPSGWYHHHSSAHGISTNDNLYPSPQKLDPFEYQIRRLIVRSRKVSKPQNLHLESSDHFWIWQASRQWYYRGACQISKWSCNSNYQSRDFEISRDLIDKSSYWILKQTPGTDVYCNNRRTRFRDHVARSAGRSFICRPWGFAIV